jgi:hypothetical protein
VDWLEGGISIPPYLGFRSSVTVFTVLWKLGMFLRLIDLADFDWRE